MRVPAQNTDRKQSCTNNSWETEKRARLVNKNKTKKSCAKAGSKTESLARVVGNTDSLKWFLGNRENRKTGRKHGLAQVVVRKRRVS